MALKGNYLIEFKDNCFISDSTAFFEEEHLVIACEMSEGNLDDYII